MRLTNSDMTSGNTFDIRFTGYGGYPAAKISSIFTNQTSSPAGALAFLTTTNGAAGFGERMRIDPNGNVGIGTSTPVEKLDVSGGIRINGVGQMYGAASGIQFTNSTGVNTVSILDNGDVGIGIAPTNVLSIMHSTPTLAIYDSDYNPSDGTYQGKVAFGAAGAENAKKDKELQNLKVYLCAKDQAAPICK